MKLQFVSDLHLEKRSRDRMPRVPDRHAPVLCLLGDIGDPGSTMYATYLRACAERFDRVILLLGNHECYGRTVEGALEAAQEAASDCPNATVLEMGTVDVQGYRFAGATLWSEVDPDTYLDFNDRWHIVGHTREDALARHGRAREFFAGELERAERDGVPLVCLSHHAPTLATTVKYAGSCHMSGYATELTDLLRPPCVAWLHGHTHESHWVPPQCGRPLFASNCLGYPQELGGCGFSWDAVVDLARGSVAGLRPAVPSQELP